MEHVTKAQVKFVRSLQLKKNRDESGLFVAEGEKCVEELRKGFQLELLVVSSEKLVVSTEYRVVSGEKVVVATREEIERMSGVETPQGVVGVFKKQDGKPTGRPEAYGREDASLQDGQRPTGVIVFGNEGKGISEEVRKYISEPIRIPSYPEGAETSESLNVAIAAAIVLAEFRRA